MFTNSFFLSLRSVNLGSNLSLHDITIAYKDSIPGIRTSEASIMKGQFPPEIHLVVHRYLIDELPSDRLELDKVISYTSCLDILKCQ